MEQAISTQAMPHVREEKKESSGINYPTFIVVAIVLMLVALIYVGSHIRMTELEYKVTAGFSAHEQMKEEQKLKLECAMLKSPQRIESIARSRLLMSYPEQDQVIVLKIRENSMVVETKKRLKIRIVSVLLIFLILFIALLSRAFQLQILSGQKL
ncbi:MAG: cell division protein FtsL [Desulfomicrobium escambiense]|nr:cell division protein FtsL [Desulfomicrobium escambiense]